MKITGKKLTIKVAELKEAKAVFRQKREEMRAALQDHLQSFEGTGELSNIAKRMDISLVQLSNLKGGYSLPSIATAEDVLRATA